MYARSSSSLSFRTRLELLRTTAPRLAPARIGFHTQSTSYQARKPQHGAPDNEISQSSSARHGLLRSRMARAKASARGSSDNILGRAPTFARSEHRKPVGSVYRLVSTEKYGGEAGHVRCETHAAIEGGHLLAKVVLTRVKRSNALTPSMLEAIALAFRDLASKSDIRCVVLTSDSASKSFCTGMDLGHLAQLNSPQQAERLISQVYEACQAIREVDVVTIAEIHGLCFGAGLELAAACDFRYVDENSLFAMPEVELGIPSVVHARLLANLMGWQKTRQLVLAKRSLMAEEAYTWGLVDKVFNFRGAVSNGVQKLALRLANHGPEAMKVQKRLVRLWEEQGLDAGIKAGVAAFSGMFANGAVEPKQYIQQYMKQQEVAKAARAKDEAQGNEVAESSNASTESHQRSRQSKASSQKSRYPRYSSFNTWEELDGLGSKR